MGFVTKSIRTSTNFHFEIPVSWHRNRFSFSLQILRPLCILPTETSYCYSSGSCTTSMPKCLLRNLNYRCPSLASVNCAENVDCQLGLLVCPDGVTFNSTTLGTPYELLYSTLVYLSMGFNVLKVNQTRPLIRTADIVALGAIANTGAGIANADSGGNAFVLNGNHLNVGGIMAVQRDVNLEKTHHSFDLEVFYIPSSKMELTMGNFPVGHWTPHGILASEKIGFSMKASISIANISWIIPDFVATNESFDILIPPHQGHNVTYRIRISEGDTGYPTYNLSNEVQLFHTWPNISKTIQMVLKKEGTETLILTATNLLSTAQRACQVRVLDKVENLYLFHITPTPLGNSTEISWVIERGTNVTYNVSFGDGNFNKDLFPSVAILVSSYTHTYNEEGNYTVTLTAFNDASSQIVTGKAQVEAQISNLTCKVIHASRDIEVNETIQLNASYPKGTNAMAFINFGDGSSVVDEPNHGLICRDRSCRTRYYKTVSHSYFPHSNYSVNFTFVNQVSKRTCLVEVIVHKPVYNLTGFNITCRPTNYSSPTRCILSITGGNDFWCDWQFGANHQKTRSHYWNLTLPVENTYLTKGNFTVTANCSNRLYNTTVVGNAIVQEPVTGYLVTSPDAQSVDADFNLLIDVTTGTSMEFEISLENIYMNNKTMQRNYLTDKKAQDVPISRYNFLLVGIYLLTVKVLNLVTPLQTFTREIKVEKVVTNFRLLNNDTFIPVNATTKSSILIDTGTNVTVEWDFKDGHRSTSFFRGDSLRFTVDHRAHTYQEHGTYLLNVTASNAVSKQTFMKYISVQYVVKDIFIASDSPKEIPPGTVTFTVSAAPDTHPPTNATIDMDFGDGQTTTGIPLGGLQAINISSSYVIPGIIPVNMTIKNDVSVVSLKVWVDVQTSVKDLQILTYHTAGDAGYGAPGKGLNKDSFPLEHSVLLVARISNGTAVTYTWSFGDGEILETNETGVEHRFTSPRYFNITLTAKNSISVMVVSRMIRMMESVVNVTFENNSPTVIDFETTLFVSVGQIGTESCFLLDLGNNTRILYRGVQGVTCDDKLTKTNDIRVLPSLEFAINFTYWRVFNYFVAITALNDVSRITLHGWVIILNLPCEFPFVQIPDAGKSYHNPTKYHRADYITIKSRCIIDCLASRTSAFHWDLTKISDGADNGTIVNDLFDYSLSVLIIPQRTLPYGKFMLRLNVSMVGLPLVHRAAVSYIEIVPSPLVAEIIGGNAWIQSVHREIILDASPSHDPDQGEDEKQDLEYLWYCKTADELYEFPSVPERSSNRSYISEDGGCFMNGTRRLLVNTEIVEIPARLLWVNKTYIFKFFITKALRMGMFVVRVSLTNEDRHKVMSIFSGY